MIDIFFGINKHSDNLLIPLIRLLPTGFPTVGSFFEKKIGSRHMIASAAEGFILF